MRRGLLRNEVLISPFLSAVALPMKPLGGNRLGGLKTEPMFLQRFSMSLFLFIVNEYYSPGLRPVREIKTSVALFFS